jgi:hypothetical protein
MDLSGKGISGTKQSLNLFLVVRLLGRLELLFERFEQALVAFLS